MLLRLALNAISHRFPLPRYALPDTERAIRDRVRSGGGRDGEAATGRLRLHGMGRSTMFSLSINHIINKGKDGAWLSVRRLMLCTLLKAAHVPDHLRTKCFLARPLGSTCHFFWSFSNLDRTTDKPSRYLSENPISLKQGTSLFPSKRGLVKISVNCS